MAEIKEQNGLVEFSDTSGLSPSLSNDDILPTKSGDRSWNFVHIASLWVGMSVCIPTYMLASSMITGGLSWIEALTMILLGNVIVAIPMIFNGHAGTKYGIPFPVLGRASFGTMGIQVPSILRAIVACGWFGIQTWLGGLAIVGIFGAITGMKDIGSNWNAQFVGFLVFWLIQMFFVWKGTESIKVLETLAAPLLIIIGIAMLYWGVTQAGGLDKVLKASYKFSKPTVVLTKYQGNELAIKLNLIRGKDGKIRAQEMRIGFADSSNAKAVAAAKEKLTKTPFFAVSKATEELKKIKLGSMNTAFVQFKAKNKPLSSVLTVSIASGKKLAPAKEPKEKKRPTPWLKYLIWLTAMVAFWATLALNIPDITRYAKSQKDQALGQFLGLPTTMVLYSFIGVAVTCAAVLIFDDILIVQDAPWDPVRLINRLQDRPVMLIVAQLAILLATLSTNIAANVISPANSFSNLAPQAISFRTGGFITGILGIIIMPWKLLGAIIGFLLTYGAILGPAVAILIADYFIKRRTHLELPDLYKTDGIYGYTNGVHVQAFIALLVGVAVVLLGLWVKPLKVLYDTGWFSGFIISFLVYVVIARPKVRPQAE